MEEDLNSKILRYVNNMKKHKLIIKIIMKLKRKKEKPTLRHCENILPDLKKKQVILMKKKNTVFKF